VNFHIDKFMKLGGVFIIYGWCDAYRPADDLRFTAGNAYIETVSRSVIRNDLIPFFGAESAIWGFRAYGIDDAVTPTSVTDIGLTFANGERILRLSEASVPNVDNIAHQVWTKFVAEANAKGGKILEIGSRARSGTTLRDLFGANLEYIGVDVTDGPNVDIVADAHHLSEFVNDTVDFICSISTFEHFIMPWKVVLETNKILNMGGRIFSHSHQTWPEHDVPFDYFRFSEQAWSGLFNVHTGFRIIDVKSGHPVAVSAVYNVGGPFDEMEHSVGHAMSVCVAEKIGKPMVSWDAAASLLRGIEYTY
jgi:hypothetical protein